MSERTADAIRGIGFCGVISPDGHHACIQDLDHAGPHGWEKRTADAEHQAMLAAIYEWLPDGWDQINPVPQYEGMLRGEALDYVDRLVARNQQLQEALAALCEAAADLLADDDMPNHWDDCVCSYCTRNRALRAALASVRARTPARDGEAG